MKVVKQSLMMILISILSVLVLCITNANHILVNAQNTKYVSKNQKWANQFKRQGYAYSLRYGNHDYILTNLSKHAYDKVVKDKVRFKVRHIGTYKNAISFNLVSKNGKYNTDASYSSDFYYTDSRNKRLKPIVKLERDIFLNSDKNLKAKYKKLYSMINKLSNGKDKSVAKSSYYQLKKYLKTNSREDIPYLLIGNI
ncbi:hypothetical protein [Apilactobacillus timberlakei]|uniref:hypothetical protein n=1 Tax=Apilactobacillus timberlakei TaxID=2008380 RepID=UPI00112DFCCF|nr:hypothetical protein [Apilactobacillus timberlakei]TPR16274.1 hypothetical protein DYZ95_07860 [Apilactobacillus timberlakei]TPR21555.1 hypothetical protein DY083_05910 [Apilactobacillus timberlakei]